MNAVAHAQLTFQILTLLQNNCNEALKFFQRERVNTDEKPGTN